jgi:D-beta-D-heptose 7-phosphate kinase/D-beta-D-heptose 1-phosphate adenosyltransferase
MTTRIEEPLASWVPRLAGRTVLVVGDAMLDEHLLGRVSRISPEAPIPIVEIVESRATAGGAANVARNIIAFGGTALLCGVCGQDEAGQRLRRALSDEGIADHLVEDPRRPTTVKTRIIAHQQQMLRFDREKAAAVTGRPGSLLLQTALSLLAQAQAVIISDYAKGVVSSRLASAVIAAAQSAGKPVLVDPKGRDYNKYRGATLVTPNLSEAATAVGHEIKDESALQAAMRHLLRKLRSDGVVVTQGAEGLSLLEADGAFIHLPAVAREVHDGTGAGDTTVATTALAVAAGAPFRTAVALANYAAGVVVGKLGTGVVTPKELIDALPGNY